MQSFVTIVMPFDEKRVEHVDPLLERLAPKQNTAQRTAEGSVVANALDATGVIHFLSIVALEPGSPADIQRKWPSLAEEAQNRASSSSPDAAAMTPSGATQRRSSPPKSTTQSAQLMIEVTSDVGTDETLERLVDVIGAELTTILDAAAIDWRRRRPFASWLSGAPGDRNRLAAFLRAHCRAIDDTWRGSSGHIHCGSPGMTVERIRAEAALALQVREWVVRQRASGWSALFPVQRLERVRDWIWDDPGLPAKDRVDRATRWVFDCEPAPLLQDLRADHWATEHAVAFVVWHVLWPLAIVATLILTEYSLLSWIDSGLPIGAPPSAALDALRLAWPGFWSAQWPRVVALVAFVVLIRSKPPVRLRRSRPASRHPVATLVVPALLVLSFAIGPLDAIGIFVAVAAGLLLAAAVVVGSGFLLLEKKEARDPTNDVTPPLRQVEELMAYENFSRQNHMFTASCVKPGIIRAFALRTMMSVIGANGFVSRPGFLGANGVIHSGRWMWLPDDRCPWWKIDAGRLLFWSNYDGTWESYVADFIADSPTGVTGLWSNCIGFPHTVNLIGEGARNRDRLVRWARRQQQPTRFWYSAYPELTADRIRINAAIRQGLASAETDADARDWLSLFGSKPRPAGALQRTQIPTLAFGALSRLPFATCFLIQFTGERVDPRKAWLKRASEWVSFGEYLPGQRYAVALSLSASALRKLDIPLESLATFPPVFQEGMSSAARARALGDVDDSDPGSWTWGAGQDVVDVFMIVYADTEDGVTRQWSEMAPRRAETAGVRVLHEVPLAPTARHRGERQAAAADRADAGDREQEVPGRRGSRTTFNREPFDFADGVSQPVIRGLPWGDNKVAHNDLVGPGELILGYPDNLGQIPPSPSIAAGRDPAHALADEGTDPLRLRPEFSTGPDGSGERDLGANGTYFVVRHLEQLVDVWHAWLDEATNHVKDNVIIATDGTSAALLWSDDESKKLWDDEHPLDDGEKDARREAIRHAIAAKLIGRWQDGTPLSRFPTMPKGFAAALDNSFRSGAEDPEGMGCPLGAHTRRANPRDTRFPGSQDEIDTVNRHRMLRVGRSYAFAADDDARKRFGARGMMFMCLNADIDRQFEFVHKSWLLNPSIHGLDGQQDPIIGPADRTLSIPTPSGIVRLPKMPRFVKVRGGGYFFMPGRATLNFLAGGNEAGKHSIPSSVARNEVPSAAVVPPTEDPDAGERRVIATRSTSSA